jgi:hypothetical protein
VTWKYKGMENIIDICAAICRASIAYELATFRSKSNLRGKIGSLAYFCSKRAKAVPKIAVVARSEMTVGEVQEIPRLGMSVANMNATMVMLINIEPMKSILPSLERVLGDSWEVGRGSGGSTNFQATTKNANRVSGAWPMKDLYLCVNICFQ